MISLPRNAAVNAAPTEKLGVLGQLVGVAGVCDEV